jgi:hypothetical protein
MLMTRDSVARFFVARARSALCCLRHTDERASEKFSRD